MIIGILLCFCVEMTNTGFCFVLLKYFCYYIKLSILYIFIYLFGHCVPLARDHQETVHSSSSSSFTKLVFLCLVSSDDVFFFVNNKQVLLHIHSSFVETKFIRQAICSMLSTFSIGEEGKRTSLSRTANQIAYSAMTMSSGGRTRFSRTWSTSAINQCL